MILGCHPRGGQTLLCELGEIQNDVHFLFCCPVDDNERNVLFTKTSSIYADFFWFYDYGKLELCFRKGTFLGSTRTESNVSSTENMYMRYL